jgi:hypothetical protein
MTTDLLTKAQEILSRKESDRIRAAEALIKDLRKQLKAKDLKIEEMEQTIDLICLLENINHTTTPIITPKSKTNTLLPIIQWSDWHVEEKVDKRKTQGKNAYNLEIAKERSIKCAQSTVKMIRHYAKFGALEKVLLVLGGDFITGDIHEELCETNLLGPAEACVYAYELLADGIDALAREKYLKEINVLCIVGNHGRTTKKMRFKNGTEKSFETIIYAFLQKRFTGPRFNFIIPAGGVCTVPLTPSFVIRAFHGHQFKYQGGIGGLTIPMTKWIHRQDQSFRANFNLCHHWHQYGLPNPNCLVNGSLKGHDEYATEHGFPYEPAQQAGCILDCDRNRVGSIFPIFCE